MYFLKKVKIFHVNIFLNYGDTRKNLEWEGGADLK